MTPAAADDDFSAELSAQGLDIASGELAGVSPTHVGGAVDPSLPQWRVEPLSPGDDRRRQMALPDHLEQVGSVAGDDDLGGSTVV